MSRCKNDPPLFIYCVMADDSEAERIGRIVVEERLAACINRFSGMRSIYRWEGSVETATETVCIIKTRQSLVSRLEQRIAALHSYECPCIVHLPVAGGHPPYLLWLLEQTNDTY